MLNKTGDSLPKSSFGLGVPNIIQQTLNNVKPTVTRIASNPVQMSAPAPSFSSGMVGPTPVMSTPQYNAMGAMEGLQSQYASMLAAQQQALEQQYQARVGQIGQSYTAGVQGIQDTGNRIAGSLARTLGRAGAFTTTAGATAQANQQQSVQNQIGTLTSARDQALAEAMAAKQSGNADLYEKSLTNMMSAQREMNNIYQFEKQQELAKQKADEDRRRFELGLKLDEQKTQREMGLSGYEKIANKSGLKGLKEDQIYRDPTTNIIYKKPAPKLTTGFETIGGGKYLVTYDPANPKNTLEKVYLGPSGTGGGGGAAGKATEDFYKDLKSAKDELMSGNEWGSVVETLVAKYGPQYDIFDKVLGGGYDPEKALAEDPNNKSGYWGWAKPGKFQEFKQSTFKQDTNTNSGDKPLTKTGG